jgi:hypothetical protein
MKTLKMNLESIQGKLSRVEMKNINGGQNQQAMGCSCNGAVNPPYNSSWVDIYSSLNDMASAISTHCANGGSCSAISIL